MGDHIIEEVRTRADECEIEEAVRFGYLKTDSEFLKEDAGGGTCCVTALLRNGKLIVSNAGDCRAVLSRSGMAEALTSDHRPSRKDERDRIESFVSLKSSISISVYFWHILNFNYLIFLHCFVCDLVHFLNKEKRKHCH